MSELNKEDIEEYFLFLQSPPSSWCTKNNNSKGSDRKPFSGKLTGSTFNTEVRILNSLLNYLVMAKYLTANLIKLIRKYKNLSIDLDQQKYNIWARMLEEDEWSAVQTTLEEIPDHTTSEKDNKARTQFLFSMLYFLGLRINEVAEHSWNSFRLHNNSWWFFVKGKGNKLGHISVNDQLLLHIKFYRSFLGKSILPVEDDFEHIFISKKTKRPLSARQLYNLVKDVGGNAANKFSDLKKKNKLKKLSPHWLRHLSASHQSKAGLSRAIIQANHRHSSSSTTDIYIHAEDELRFKEMQKIAMEISPSITALEVKAKPTILQIKLQGGNITGEKSLVRLLDSIENNILGSFNWQISIERGKVIDFYINNLNKELILEYSIDGNIDNYLDFIVASIEREAKIRLFKVKVNFI